MDKKITHFLMVLNNGEASCHQPFYSLPKKQFISIYQTGKNKIVARINRDADLTLFLGEVSCLSFGGLNSGLEGLDLVDEEGIITTETRYSNRLSELGQNYRSPGLERLPGELGEKICFLISGYDI